MPRSSPTAIERTPFLRAEFSAASNGSARYCLGSPPTGISRRNQSRREPRLVGGHRARSRAVASIRTHGLAGICDVLVGGQGVGGVSCTTFGATLRRANARQPALGRSRSEHHGTRRLERV